MKRLPPFTDSWKRSAGQQTTWTWWWRSTASSVSMSKLSRRLRGSHRPVSLISAKSTSICCAGSLPMQRKRTSSWRICRTWSVSAWTGCCSAIPIASNIMSGIRQSLRITTASRTAPILKRPLMSWWSWCRAWIRRSSAMCGRDFPAMKNYLSTICCSLKTSLNRTSRKSNR